MTDNDLIEWLETTIDDSFDLGWTSLDAAKLIVSRMRDQGLVLVLAQPATNLVEAAQAVLDNTYVGKHGQNVSERSKYGNYEAKYYHRLRAAIAAMEGVSEKCRHTSDRNRAATALKGLTDADLVRGTLGDSDGDDGA